MARLALLLLLSAIALPAHAAPIAYGQVIAGTLGANEQDAYTFTAPADGRVLVRVVSTAGVQGVSVDLFRVGMSSVGTAAGIGPVSTIVGANVLAGADYEVRIPAGAPTGGAYAGQTYRVLLQSLTDPAGATAVAIGSGASGAIDDVGEADFFTVPAQSGDTLLFTVDRTSGSVDPQASAFLPQFGSACTPSVGGEPDHPTVLTQCDFATDGDVTFWIDDLDDDTPDAVGGTDTGGYAFTVTCFSGPCQSATTTTTTAASTSTSSPGGSTSTTTTLAPTQLLPIDGRKLLIKTPPSKPAKKALVASSSDADITLGGGNGSADDPRTAGATLRVRSVAAGFDSTYALPAARWKAIGADGAGKGYKYADPGRTAGPVTSVVVKKKRLALTAKGTDLDVVLATDPDPVDVVFTMGGFRACASLGGKTKFTVAKKFAAKLSTAPAGCP